MMAANNEFDSFLSMCLCRPHIEMEGNIDHIRSHFRSNVNVIILAYSMLFTSKAIYQRKRQP